MTREQADLIATALETACDGIWRSVADALQEAGFSAQECVAAGAALAEEAGRADNPLGEISDYEF